MNISFGDNVRVIASQETKMLNAPKVSIGEAGKQLSSLLETSELFEVPMKVGMNLGLLYIDYGGILGKNYS